MIGYSENHHLHADDSGINAHISLHLRGADLEQTKDFVDAVLAAAMREVIRMQEESRS